MTEIVKALTKVQARKLTDQVKTNVEDLWNKLRKLHDGQAWTVLGYGSWNDYVNEEFSLSKQHCNRLIVHAKIVNELESIVVGTNGSTTEVIAPTEANSRWLNRLDEADRIDFWIDLVEESGGKRPNAKDTETAVRAYLRVSEPVSQEDPPAVTPVDPEKLVHESIELKKQPSGKFRALPGGDHPHEARVVSDIEPTSKDLLEDECVDVVDDDLNFGSEIDDVDPDHEDVPWVSHTHTAKDNEFVARQPYTAGVIYSETKGPRKFIQAMSVGMPFLQKAVETFAAVNEIDLMPSASDRAQWSELIKSARVELNRVQRLLKESKGSTS